MLSAVFSRSRLIVFAALTTLMAPPACQAQDIKQEMTAAAAAVRPALIRIHVVSTDYSQGRESKMESAGSGVIITADGYAVTNHHVAADAERLLCTLADKREVEAKLVGTDPLSDLAVIKLVSPDGKPFPFAQFGDSSKLEVGDRVYAMGSPLALSQSVTMGIISNTEMVMPEYIREDEMQFEGEAVGTIVRWIGHDALIAPGNSGGPLVSGDGKIVGVNEIEMGLSGAIPSNLVRAVVDQIIKHGKVTRSWLGMEVQPVLKSSGLDKGILISGVLEGSPAQKAGFRSGDVLVRLDGSDVVARFREEVPLFNQMVAAMPVGKTMEAVVVRDGKEETLTVTTTERAKAWEKEHEVKSWGICASNITYLMQKELQLASQDGVLVSSALPSGPSGTAKPPLQRGDVIVKVASEQVKDLTALRAVSKRITDGHVEPVPALVEFDRRGERIVTIVAIGRSEESEGGNELTKAWLPIEVQVLTPELADVLGASGRTGVRVTRVYPGSSAETAGLQLGDLIVSLDGEDIPAEQIGDEEVLSSMIRQYEVDSEAKLGVLRDGKSRIVTVKLEPSPKPARDYPKYEDELFDFVARDIAFQDRSQRLITESDKGVLVESVAEGSWAAVGRLSAGDIITELNGQSVSTLDEFKKAMKAARESRPKVLVMKVRRGIHTMFVEIKPDWSGLE